MIINHQYQTIIYMVVAKQWRRDVLDPFNIMSSKNKNCLNYDDNYYNQLNIKDIVPMLY